MKKMRNIQSTVFGLALAAALALPMACTAFADDDPVKEYVNDGMIFTVPVEYDDLLLIDMPEDADDGTLFRVSEKDSVEAAKAHGYDETEGLGFLFSIVRTDEETIKKMRCSDMSGVDIFAEGEDGSWYVFRHPTDVRIEFADDADKDAAMQQWSMLNRWGAEVSEDFIESNPGLVEKKYGNTSLDIYLAWIEFEDFKDYTLSTLEFGPLDPGDTDPTPFLERLDGLDLEYSDHTFPDGEYLVLTIPEQNVRFDFSRNADADNPDGDDFVREVVTLDDGDTYETIYEAELPDDRESVTDIMNEWYQELAKAQGAEPYAGD